MEQADIREHRQILGERFAKAKSRVRGDARPRYTSRHAGLNALFEIIEHLKHHVVISGVVLHGLGLALGMHQHDVEPCFRRDSHTFWVIRERRHVIQNFGAGFGSRLGHSTFARVD